MIWHDFYIVGNKPTVFCYWHNLSNFTTDEANVSTEWDVFYEYKHFQNRLQSKGKKGGKAAGETLVNTYPRWVLTFFVFTLNISNFYCRKNVLSRLLFSLSRELCSKMIPRYYYSKNNEYRFNFVFYSDPRCIRLHTSAAELFFFGF